jgi:hypothetical protein
MEKSCFDIVSISRGVLKSITLLGNLFIRKQATRKASPQNYRGTDEWARSARPVSTIW